MPPPRPVPFFRWELTGGYAHITGNQGLDGFNAGASFFLDPKISIGFNYDGVYDTSTLGAFALTNVGLTVSKSHLQDFLAGPRFYFPGLLKGHGNIHGHILHPFVHAQFGESNLYSKLTSVNIGTVTSSDTEFTWVLGGGVISSLRTTGLLESVLTLSARTLLTRAKAACASFWA